jgi:hypothetical protein
MNTSNVKKRVAIILSQKKKNKKKKKQKQNSPVNITKTQWTNHILKGLCGKPVQNCAHIPILIIPLLDQRTPQPNTQMRQPNV